MSSSINQDGWNWRIFKQEKYNERLGSYTVYWVGEAYYTDNKITSWSEPYAMLSDDESLGLKETYDLIGEAFKQSVVTIGVDEKGTDLVATDKEAI